MTRSQSINPALHRRARRIGVLFSVVVLSCVGCSTSNPYDPFNTPAVKTLERSATYFDCEALPGRYSLSQQPLQGRIAEIWGEFRVLHGRSNPRWTPGVSFALRDEWGDILIGASLSEDRSSGNLYGQVLTIRQGEVQRQPTGLSFQIREPVKVSISVSADQSTGQVRFGDATSVFEVPLYGEPTSLTMRCNSSWSELNFEDIRYYDVEENVLGETSDAP